MHFKVKVYHLVTHPGKRKTTSFKLDILRFGIWAMCVYFLLSQKIFS